MKSRKYQSLLVLFSFSLVVLCRFNRQFIFKTIAKCVFNTYFIISHPKHLYVYLFTNITKQSNVSMHCTFWQYIFWVFLAIGCIFLFYIELNKKKDYCGPTLWLTQSKYHVMFAWSLEIFLALLFSNTLSLYFCCFL